MHQHGPSEKHRLPQRFKRIGEDQERLALQLPQLTQLVFPATLAQLALGQNYGLAAGIAPPRKGKCIPFLPSQHEDENFRLSAHLRNSRREHWRGRAECWAEPRPVAGCIRSAVINAYLQKIAIANTYQRFRKPS